MNRRKLAVSTPGRICLFGEHQDYLGLPVIAAAISLRIRITGVARDDRRLQIDLPDVGDSLSFEGDGRLKYLLERDYFRSGYNVVWDRGLRLLQGWDCVVRGNIPINSGTSSSSALMVAWIKFLLAAIKDCRANDVDLIARLAYQAEVLEFDEPGGMMDHFATAFGSIIYLDFAQNEVECLRPQLGAFVLGDSRQPKDTKGILGNVREVAQEAVQLLHARWPDFSLRSTPLEEVHDALHSLPPRHAEILRANLVDRDLLRAARRLLVQETVDHEQLGRLLTAHHEQLSRYKRVSTTKIDRLLAAALAAGALGGKINGSGGGGCMFAYAPQHAEAVAEAIRAAGGVPYIVSISDGVRVEEDTLV